MADILTAADIAELRRDWVVDEIDARPEWGPGTAKVSAGASAGAAFVALSGLGTGTLRRGTPFTITTGTTPVRYTVTADATITGGAATVYVSPLLEQAALANDLVRVERYYRSVFNRVFGRLMFSDVDLEDFARRAEEQWGARIHDAGDPRRMRSKAIGLLALTAKLESTEYESAVIQLEAQDGGRAHMERLEKRRAEYESAVTRRATGPVLGTIYR